MNKNIPLYMHYSPSLMDFTGGGGPLQAVLMALFTSSESTTAFNFLDPTSKHVLANVHVFPVKCKTCT